MYPDQYQKIKFETGEIAWIRHEDDTYLYLIFCDLSSGSRRKSNLPKYNFLNCVEGERKHV